MNASGLPNGNDRKAFKSGVWYMLSNFLIKSIAFLITPIFTRVLTKTEFGLYNNYASWQAIFMIIVTLNLDSTLISARYDYEEDLDSYILSVLSLSAASTALWLVAFNLFRDYFVTALGIEPVYLNTMLLYLMFLPAVNLYQARERYAFEYKKTVASSLTISIGTALLSVILVLKLPDKLFGRIVGSVIPTVLLGACFYCFFIRKGQYVKTKYWKYALPICLPFIPHLLSLNLLNSMDRVMITKWCTAEDTAMYSLAYTCGSMVTLLMVSMNSAFAPWLGEKLHNAQYKEIRSFSKIYILGFSYMAVGIMMAAPEILYILGGPPYLEAKYVMTPISMGCLCQFLYTMFVNVEQFKKKTIGMAFASMSAALVNFILNYIFIPRIGYLAAAYTTLAGYMILLGIHMFLVYRLGYSEVYDSKFVLSTFCVMMLISIGITILYAHTAVRYILLILYIVSALSLLVKNKSRIMALIRRRS